MANFPYYDYRGLKEYNFCDLDDCDNCNLDRALVAEDLAEFKILYQKLATLIKKHILQVGRTRAMENIQETLKQFPYQVDPAMRKIHDFAKFYGGKPKGQTAMLSPQTEAQRFMSLPLTFTELARKMMQLAEKYPDTLPNARTYSTDPHGVTHRILDVIFNEEEQVLHFIWGYGDSGFAPEVREHIDSTVLKVS